MVRSYRKSDRSILYIRFKCVTESVVRFCKYMNFPANADVLASLLRPFGVSATDSSDISDDSDTKNDDYKLLKTYLPQVYQPETASITPVSNETPAEKRRREGWQVGGWKKRTKLPYTTSMFYRDYHNINVQDVTHRDAK